MTDLEISKTSAQDYQSACESVGREDHELPELDSSLPDNDLGNMASAILVCLIAMGSLVWWLK